MNWIDIGILWYIIAHTYIFTTLIGDQQNNITVCAQLTQVFFSFVENIKYFDKIN